MSAASQKVRDRVRNACIRLSGWVLPPPYYDPKMEFRYGVWGGVSSMHCRYGRQLGENNVVPHRLKETMPTELQVFRNGGSRDGRYFNKSALRHAMRNWDPAMALIGDMRREYLRRRGSVGEPLGLFDVYTLAKLCVCLPAWQTRQRHAPLKDRRLDPVIATVFQLTAGMFMVIRKMLARGEPGLDASSRMTPEELYDYADHHGVFLSPNGHACGGSRRKIIELMDFLITGIGRHAGREEGLKPPRSIRAGFTVMPCTRWRWKRC